MTHWWEGVSLLPCHRWKVFMRVPAHALTSAELASSPTRLNLMFRLSVLSAGRLSFFFFASHGLWLRGQVNRFMPTLVGWSICAQWYFWRNVFHLVSNDFSKVSVIQASRLGMNTYQATFHFER